MSCKHEDQSKLANKMASFMEIRNARRADGLATILAIGTANPPNVMSQAEFPDFYFRVTKAEHMTELKDKFKHICNKTTIKKRYMYITEEFLKDNPHMCDFNASSLDTRQDILATEVPKLGQEAAIKAIEEWAQRRSKITHLIFSTVSGVSMPGADYELANLLGLDPSVRRFMLYQQGCYDGGTVLRLAKDIAENNRGARVLVVCAEMTVVGFRGPTEAHMESMIGQALFTDGAGAVIVGADPDESINERPIFELAWASQKFIPGSKWAIAGQLRQVGLTIHLSKDVPKLISNNLETSLVEGFDPIGINDWNSIFWVAHPGGPAILDEVEAKLGLHEEKLRATRHVLREYGNMSSASVLFVLDETRKRSYKEGKSTTGHGLDWGVLFGFGPGITIETVVLRSVPIKLDY